MSRICYACGFDLESARERFANEIDHAIANLPEGSTAREGLELAKSLANPVVANEAAVVLDTEEPSSETSEAHE